tara:strand:+ start:371 stop:544 length:174 start_codon:yes stop_codon:yes gene_type:complete
MHSIWSSVKALEFDSRAVNISRKELTVFWSMCLYGFPQDMINLLFRNVLNPIYSAMQ